MKKLINIVIVGVVGLLIISLHYSCTTYEAPDGIAEDGFDSDSVISTTIHRKVLWINIDVAEISRRAVTRLDQLPYKNEFLDELILELVNRKK